MRSPIRSGGYGGGRKKVHVNTAHWSTSRLLSTAARLNEHDRTRRLLDLGVTSAGATTLKALSDSGPINQIHLAALVHVQAQTMGKLLEKLEVKGLVSRLRDIGDRRSNRIRITPQGTRVVGRIQQIAMASPESPDPSDTALRKQLIRIITGLEATPA
jgi:DNA-binding MarR family transcriptional regulator